MAIIHISGIIRVDTHAELPTLASSSVGVQSWCVEHSKFYYWSGSSWLDEPGGEAHPDLAAHDALGLATQDELDTHTHPGGSGEAETLVRKTGDTANSTTNMADA